MAPGACLAVLFGGPHQSAPSFARFGVREGDFVYPVRVHKGVLFVIARMRVERIVPLGDYSFDPAGAADRIPFGCVDEVAIGTEGEPIRFDRRFPGERLEHLRFVSKHGDRGLKYVENGLLKRAVSLQGGVYRLAAESAAEFAATFG